MGNLYLLRARLATEVDQMMKPEMTSSTASSVVTMIDSDPLTAAIPTRTSSNTLQHKRSCSSQSHRLAAQVLGMPLDAHAWGEQPLDGYRLHCLPSQPCPSMAKWVQACNADSAHATREAALP